jgi:uncharacterized alkaline shock family protein YloU
MPTLADTPKPKAKPTKPGTTKKIVGTHAEELTGTSTAPARVRFSKGVTKNMGDYNSARVDVTIEADVNIDVATIGAIEVTISRLDEMVTKELEKQVNDLDL